MSFIRLFLNNTIDKKLDRVEIGLLEETLPSNLSPESKHEVAMILKKDPKISSKVENLKSDVYEQMQLGFVMFINALIGLIPVPLIPGLIRTSNNILFQMFKTSDKILEFKEIIDISRLLLVKNPAINRILENKDIDMDKFHQNKDLMIEKVAESAKKAFEEIDNEFLQKRASRQIELYNKINPNIEPDVSDTVKQTFDKIDIKYLQDDKLTPTQVYDKVNTLAEERNIKNDLALHPRQQSYSFSKSTPKPISLPPPKPTPKPNSLPPPETTPKPKSLPPPKPTQKPVLLPSPHPKTRQKLTQTAGKKTRIKKQKKCNKTTRINKYKK